MFNSALWAEKSFCPIRKGADWIKTLDQAADPNRSKLTDPGVTAGLHG